MATEKTYAILYLRPDGYWIAGEGWTERWRAQRDAEDQLSENVTAKIVPVRGKQYLKAKALEEAD